VYRRLRILHHRLPLWSAQQIVHVGNNLCLKGTLGHYFRIMQGRKSADHVASCWAQRLFIQGAPAIEVEVVLLHGVCKYRLSQMRLEEAWVA